MSPLHPNVSTLPTNKSGDNVGTLNDQLLCGHRVLYGHERRLPGQRSFDENIPGVKRRPRLRFCASSASVASDCEHQRAGDWRACPERLSQVPRQPFRT